MEGDVKAVPCRKNEELFPISYPNEADIDGCIESRLAKNGFKRVDEVAKEVPASSPSPLSIDEGVSADADAIGQLEKRPGTSGEKSAIDIELSKLSLADSNGIRYIDYESERQLPDITGLITLELSEPYSIYTYRYFLHNWPHLSYLAYSGSQCVGAIVCKLDFHLSNALRGYIAMLVVHKDFRRHKIGSSLVERAIKQMIHHGCDEIVLETEVTNKGALRLYENLGFVRDKRLLRYYLNGVDAWRLKLWLK